MLSKQWPYIAHHTIVCACAAGLEGLKLEPEFTCMYPRPLQFEYLWTWVNVALGTLCGVMLMVLSIPLPPHGCRCLRALHRAIATLDFKMAIVQLHKVRPDPPRNGRDVAGVLELGAGSGSGSASVRGGAAETGRSYGSVLPAPNSTAASDAVRHRSRGATPAASSVPGSAAAPKARERPGFADIKGALARHGHADDADENDDGDGHHALMHVAQHKKGTFGGMLTIMLMCAWLSNAIYDVVLLDDPTTLPVVMSNAVGQQAVRAPLVISFGFDCSAPASPAQASANCSTMGVVRDAGQSSAYFRCDQPPPVNRNPSGDTYCTCRTVQAGAATACIVTFNDTALTQTDLGTSSCSPY